MKSLKTKIVVYYLPLFIAICLGLSWIVYSIAASTIESEARSSITNVAYQGAKIVQSRINAELNALETLAALPEIYDTSIPIEEKLSILRREVEHKGHIRMGIADASGIMVCTDDTSIDVKDRVHFIKPMAGERAVSDPVVSKHNGSIIICFGVPIKENGQVVGSLISVRDGNALSDIVNDITYGQTGSAFLLNKTGTTIAHSNKDLVIDMYNAIESSKEDPSILPVARCWKASRETVATYMRE